MISKLNWRKGLTRAFLVAMVPWTIIALEVAREGKAPNENPDYAVFFLVLLGGPALVVLAGLCFWYAWFVLRWIVRGFFE